MKLLSATYVPVSFFNRINSWVDIMDSYTSHNYSGTRQVEGWVGNARIF